jgi:hypothetical protein
MDAGTHQPVSTRDLLTSHPRNLERIKEQPNGYLNQEKPTTEPRKFRERLRKLFALMGSPNAGESANARTKLEDLLKRNNKTWNDLPELLQPEKATQDPKEDEDDQGDNPYTPGDPNKPPPNVLDVIFFTLKKYLYLSDHELVAITLWILHSYTFDKFMTSPRLALLSPVRGCGKTTAIHTLVLLAHHPEKYDDMSAALLCRVVASARVPPTLLLDEGDNALGLARPGPMLSFCNSGHLRSGAFGRVINGRHQRFSTYAPLAVAAIGTLPLQLLQRAIVVKMQRAPRSAQLRTLNLSDPELMTEFGHIRRYLSQWIEQCVLDQNPASPPSSTTAEPTTGERCSALRTLAIEDKKRGSRPSS